MEATKEQKEFMQKTAAHQREKVEELAFKMLALSLAKDIPVFDLPYYIMQKSQEIVQTAYKSVNFKDKKLQKARKNFLRACLAQMKDKIVLPEPKEEKDETDTRDNRCDPLAYELAKMIVNEELIFSDEDFFNTIIENEEGVPLESAILGYSKALDEKLIMVISEHWKRSLEKLWGLEKEKVKFSDMDEVLKRV